MEPIQATSAELDRLKHMLYHTATPELAAEMEAIRVAHLRLGLAIIRTTEASRAQSIALTHLEETCMRSIQSLALKGAMQIPAAIEVLHE